MQRLLADVRLTMLLCGLSIKDAEFLFRGPNRLTP